MENLGHRDAANLPMATMQNREEELRDWFLKCIGAVGMSTNFHVEIILSQKRRKTHLWDNVVT